jgi:hypothetical protein
LIVTDRLGAIGRLKRVVAEDSPLLPFFDEEAELEGSGLRSREIANLLAQFVAARDADLAWLRTLRREDLARSGTHSAVGRMSGLEVLYHAAYHDANHVRQLLAMIEGLYEPLRGAMRAY